ncbi:MAG TPA: hypothetical protein VL992_01050, partial [Tepidisphaeraceae bacterium]|nr:hypothetical protein [Tepidisphaeraceae bacterium]
MPSSKSMPSNGAISRGLLVLLIVLAVHGSILFAAAPDSIPQLRRFGDVAQLYEFLIAGMGTTITFIHLPGGAWTEQR